MPVYSGAKRSQRREDEAIMPRGGLLAEWLFRDSAGAQSIVDTTGTYTAQNGTTAGVDATDLTLDGTQAAGDGTSNQRAITTLVPPPVCTLVAVIKASNSSTARTFIGAQNGATVRALLGTTGATPVATSGAGSTLNTGVTTMTIGSWYMIVGQYDGAGTGYTWLNTKLDKTGAYTGTPTATLPLWLGASNNNSAVASAINTSMAYAAVYNRLLSGVEIGRMYRALRPVMALRGFAL